MFGRNRLRSGDTMENRKEKLLLKECIQSAGHINERREGGIYSNTIYGQRQRRKRIRTKV